jgi:hypothetical protein
MTILNYDLQKMSKKLKWSPANFTFVGADVLAAVTHEKVKKQTTLTMEAISFSEMLVYF